VAFTLAALVLGSVARLGSARNHLLAARRQMSEAGTALIHRETDLAQARLAGAERDMRQADGAARAFPLGLLRPIPVVGSPSRAVTDVTGAGRQAIAAGRDLNQAAGDFPTSGQAGVDGHDLSGLRDAMGRSDSSIALARTRLSQARARLHGPKGALLPFVSSPAKGLDRELARTAGQLQRAHRGLALAESLTAPGRKTRLLLLSQDSLELRATGGFIGSYGVIEIDGPKISLGEYHATEELPYPDPPVEGPVRLQVTTRRPWSLANAGWWPDFPTSAAKARELFRRQGGGEVDGVVAITEHVMSRLVGVLGPIQVPGYAQPVIEEGFDQRVVYEVELKKPRDVPRKKFLTLLSDQIFARLFSLPAEKVPDVARALSDAAGSGDLQAWFAEPDQQANLEGTAVAGSIPRTDHDFLMLVDTNMTASKADAQLSRDATYSVHRDERGRLRAQLTVRFRNAGPKTSTNPYYTSYLRVYVPAGAQLVPSGDSPPFDEGIAPDGHYRVFSHDLVVEPLSESSLVFDYMLPDSVAPKGEYHLVWRRQAGTRRDSQTAVVGGEVVRFAGSGREVEVDTTLRRNRLSEFLRTRWLTRRLFD
jgi:hypothetical protein